MKVVEWIDPGPDGKPIVKQLPIADAIAIRKKLAHDNGLTYESDEEALEDFIIIYWAVVKELD